MARIHPTCHSNSRKPSPTTTDRNVDNYLLYAKVAVGCTHRQTTNYALDTTYFHLATRTQPSTTYGMTSRETTKTLVGRPSCIPCDDPHTSTTLARRRKQQHQLGTIGTHVHHLHEHRARTSAIATTTTNHGYQLMIDITIGESMLLLRHRR